MSTVKMKFLLVFYLSVISIKYTQTYIYIPTQQMPTIENEALGSDDANTQVITTTPYPQEVLFPDLTDIPYILSSPNTSPYDDACLLSQATLISSETLENLKFSSSQSEIPKCTRFKPSRPTLQPFTQEIFQDFCYTIATKNYARMQEFIFAHFNLNTYGMYSSKCKTSQRIFFITPLALAITLKDLTACALLLENGASANFFRSPQEPPLHLAACYGNKYFIELLLKFNADINTQNQRGDTALHTAISNKKLSNAQFLIKCLIAQFGSFNINLLPRNCFGESLLHAAVKTCNEKTIKFVLSYSPDLQARDLQGRTPYTVAITTPSVKRSLSPKVIALLCNGDPLSLVS